MSASIFSGLSLTRAGDAVELRYPSSIHNAPRAGQIGRAHGLEISSADRNSWLLRYPASDEDCPAPLRAFFADLNAFPAPYARALPREAAVAEPLVSCVIVVNENVAFVREQLVPSLLAHSSRHPVEIVLAYNGSAKQDPELSALRSIRCAWGAVATAYNAGGRAARGRYVAFLHDDCIIDDPAWVEKCIGALDAGADAVAGEYRRMDSIAGIAVPALPVAKCVPLVMLREKFLATGGYDEFHYVGYEDLDFTLALSQRGGKLAAVDLKLRHFGGMSSTLKYCPVPGLHLLHAMTALPAAAIKRRFKEFTDRGVALDGVDILRLALDVQLFYVLRKYHDFLGAIDARAFAAATAALERRITQGCPFDATLILPRFRELDRVLSRP